MGRKTFKDEIGILQRYSELTVPYFKVIKEHLDSSKKDDRRWAVERLDKAFVKMLPEKIEAEGVMPFTVIIKQRDGDE